METKIKYTLAGLLFLFSACADIDLTGFAYSEKQVNDRFAQSMQWNNAHPPRVVNVVAADYTFLVAGDAHVGPTVNFDAFLTEAAKPENALMIMVGDITTGKKEDFETFKTHVETLDSAKQFLMAGNHDLYFNGWDTYQSMFGSSTYTFTVQTTAGTDLFICLDTGSGTLGSKQTEWLKNILKSNRNNYRNCFVFSHTNFFRHHFTTSTNLLVEEIVMLQNLFADYHVKLVVMGHDHTSNTEVFGKTTYITLEALEDSWDNAGYLKVDVSGETITCKLLDI